MAKPASVLQGKLGEGGADKVKDRLDEGGGEKIKNKVGEGGADKVKDRAGDGGGQKIKNKVGEGGAANISNKVGSRDIKKPPAKPASGAFDVKSGAEVKRQVDRGSVSRIAASSHPAASGVGAVNRGVRKARWRWGQTQVARRVGPPCLGSVLHAVLGGHHE